METKGKFIVAVKKVLTVMTSDILIRSNHHKLQSHTLQAGGVSNHDICINVAVKSKQKMGTKPNSNSVNKSTE